MKEKYKKVYKIELINVKVKLNTKKNKEVLTVTYAT